MGVCMYALRIREAIDLLPGEEISYISDKDVSRGGRIVGML